MCWNCAMCLGSAPVSAFSPVFNTIAKNLPAAPAFRHETHITSAGTLQRRFFSEEFWKPLHHLMWALLRLLCVQ